MTGTGQWEIGAVSGRLPDNPGELARTLRACEEQQHSRSTVFSGFSFKLPTHYLLIFKTNYWEMMIQLKLCVLYSHKACLFNR